MAVARDITGKRHGRLVAIAPCGRNPRNNSVLWRCACDCGNDTVVEARLLGGKTGTRSCGCLQRESTRARPVRASTNMTHGESGRVRAPRTPEYVAWFHMRERCNKPDHPNYPSYGARGIKVCERWDISYEAFVADMGRRPSSKHSIDRINNDGNYEPGNCRWATPKEQANNRRPRGTHRGQASSNILTSEACRSQRSASSL